MTIMILTAEERRRANFQDIAAADIVIVDGKVVKNRFGDCA